MAKREKCCNENSILRYLTFGVFTPNLISPCCQEITIPDFGEFTGGGLYTQSNYVTYGNADCTYHLHVKFETTGNWHTGMVMEFFDGYDYITLSRNDWYSWNYNPSTADPMYFAFSNGLYPTETKCVTMHFKNTTCNLNYGAVGLLCSGI